MSFSDVDDTLVAYFKQMLEEESAESSDASENALNTEAVTENSAEISAAADDKVSESSDAVDNVESPADESALTAEAAETVTEAAAEADTIEASDTESATEEIAESETAAEETAAEAEIAEASDETAAEEPAAEAEAIESSDETAAEEPAAEAEIAEASDETAAEETAAETEDTEASDETAAEEIAAEAEIDEDPSAEQIQASDNIVVDEKAVEAARALSSDEDDIDYASDSYVPPVADNESHDPKLQTVVSEQKAEPLPFAEQKSLESLLESVPKTQVEIHSEVKVENAVEQKVALQSQTAVETVTAATVETTKEETVEASKEKVDDDNASPYDWTNIEMPDEFQVLFFLVKGIRFAVPLVNLGGIFQCDKVTPLFGKPLWFQGIADVHGKKMNIVDTLKWVKSDAPQSDKYEYMITLDDTLWAIGCDSLEGNRILNKENITWRQTAGNRPWLAGIVKKEMCALLHVKALVKMFENGVNLKDLDVQMSA